MLTLTLCSSLLKCHAYPDVMHDDLQEEVVPVCQEELLLTDSQQHCHQGDVGLRGTAK